MKDLVAQPDRHVECGIDLVGVGGGGEGDEAGENERNDRELHGVLLRAGFEIGA